VNRYHYKDSWGNFLLSCPSANKGKPCIPNRYAFTGREWDADIALYHYRARWYDPETKRFTQEDPIILDINPYVYVKNRPISKRDPFGMWEYAKEYGTTGEKLTSNMSSIESIVDKTYMSVAETKAVVTYTTNGTHSKNSLHYSGNAIDLRTRNLTSDERKKVVASLKEELGSDYDVIDEEDHIHVEYDPKDEKKTDKKGNSESKDTKTSKGDCGNEKSK
jgi:RHS repeat-associated protein